MPSARKAPYSQKVSDHRTQFLTRAMAHPSHGKCFLQPSLSLMDRFPVAHLSLSLSAPFSPSVLTHAAQAVQRQQCQSSGSAGKSATSIPGRTSRSRYATNASWNPLMPL